MNSYFLYGLGQCISKRQSISKTAAEAGISKRQLSKILHGQCECRIYTLEKINAAFGDCSIEQYIYDYPSYYMHQFIPFLGALTSLEPEEQGQLLKEIQEYLIYYTSKAL